MGDLWSYNAKDDVFAVSPDPDLHVYDVNVLKDRCLVLATDGAWNVVTPDMAVQCVSESEKSNEKHMIDPQVILTVLHVCSPGLTSVRPLLWQALQTMSALCQLQPAT